MDEDRISERSWDALAERSLPAYMQETSSSGRFTSRRRMLSRNRKSLTVRYGDDDAVDVDDDDSDDDDEIQRAQPVPSSTTPIFIPVPATATVTITAAAAAATPERDCYLKDQASTTSQDADACKKYHSSPSNDHYQSSALQTGAEKAGLVVGLTVGLSMIVCLIVFLTLRRKYRPGFTLWSCLTRRKRSSEFDDRKWAPLGDGGDGAVWPDKSKARPVTMTVQELDAGLVETVARKPSLRERDSESNTVTASEKATENTTRPAQARLTIETRSSGSWRTENEKELLDLMRESESESDPPPTAKTRRPWMSYFSWSTAPTTPACSSNRETMMTDDSEPPRFRSISSWVNYQSERQQRQRQRQTSGVVLLPPPIVERRSKFHGNPPYPPTPPIPRQTRSVEEEEKPRLSSFLESPSPKTAAESDQLSQPAKAMTPSARHNSVRSSVSTLPVFRAHPGEEVDIGQTRRIRSSSLRRLMGVYY